MKKLFSLAFPYKIMLIFLLLMNVSFFFTGYAAKTLTETTLLKEKQDKLLSFGRILDTHLEPGGYAAVLRKHGAENAPREEQIRVLNKALSEVTDIVAGSAPGLGVGYYSLAQDAIVTYGPSSSFQDAVGISIPQAHPGREVMATGREMVSTGTMVRGDIMNAMVPVVRDGKVVGYIWANELTTEITAQFNASARNIFLVMLTCLGITMGLLILISRRTMRDISGIIEGVREMRSDLHRRIPPASGELGEVAAGINAMAEDISKAGEETARAVAVLQNIMANVDTAVYVCDLRTKTLIFTDRYLQHILSRDDLQGKTCYEVLHGYTTPCSFCPEKQLFDTSGNPIFTPVQRESRHQKSNRDFLITDRLVTWPDGRVLLMEMATDITERKALLAAEAANLAQREFLARMSHEIRTPMNGVLGMTRLAMQASPPPIQLEYLKKIQSSASLLLGIINDILDFSRIEAGKLQIEKHIFNLHEAVENIRELILPRVRENALKFTVQVDDSVPEYVLGDELRLSQVLLNLLGNAAKFTLSGFVALEVRAEPLPDNRIKLHCAVKDSGIGLNHEQQMDLFSPFSQADSSISRKFGGTGLGLSICKALVGLMDGSIGVESEVGKGSTFFFFIALEQAEKPLHLPAGKNVPWEDARYDGRCFLVVEDNSVNQEIAEALLSELGAKVDIASNGEEGVRAFLSKDYDLILMDVRMPVMDGFEATRRIRADAKHDARTVSIIAMTANAMLEDREASIQAGMNDHIAKPIDVNELKRVLFRETAANEK